MAHPAQLSFIHAIKGMYGNYFTNSKVLEVGSLNINGTVRQFFDDPQLYIGLDVGEGPGVDVVCDGDEYDTDERFDCVISCECMEHNPAWKETFANMIRLCRPGGLVIMTCATTGRLEHGTSRTTPQDSPLTIGKGWEYYCNLTPRDFTELFDLGSYFRYFGFETNPMAHDLYFVGVKHD